MDGLDTLSQIALAHADQLALLEAAVQQCNDSNQPTAADQDLLSIPDEDILKTSANINASEAMSLDTNFIFNEDTPSESHQHSSDCLGLGGKPMQNKLLECGKSICLIP